MYNNDQISPYLITVVCLLKCLLNIYINCILPLGHNGSLVTLMEVEAEQELMEYHNELIIVFVLINYTSLFIEKMTTMNCNIHQNTLKVLVTRSK